MASKPCMFCWRSEKIPKAVITDVLVKVSFLKLVLKLADADKPYAQPVSGVLNKIGIAR